MGAEQRHNTGDEGNESGTRRKRSRKTAESTGKESDDIQEKREGIMGSKVKRRPVRHLPNAT